MDVEQNSSCSGGADGLGRGLLLFNPHLPPREVERFSEVQDGALGGAEPIGNSESIEGCCQDGAAVVAE